MKSRTTSKNPSITKKLGMHPWQKFCLVSTTIAILSLIGSFINRDDCQCQFNNSIINSKQVDFQYQFKVEDFEDLVVKDKIEQPRRPKHWFYHQNGTYGHYVYEIVDLVLNRLNFEKIFINISDFHYDWDILWSTRFHDLQYLPIDWSKLKFYQKINHIPGNYVIVSKSVLGSTTDSKYIPKAFTDIEKLKRYAAHYPDKRFVMKLKSNRGVQLKKVSEMNFKESEKLNDYFAQEFIENPLLFDGHKFDFAVYVAVTSIQPLRAYYYTKNMIFRFCPKKYDLSDPTETDRYVVSDSKITVQNFNGTKAYFENGYNTKDAFEGFLKGINVDVADIWRKIENGMREILMLKENDFIYWTKKFETSKHNHFELIRFDMILDTNLNLHIIEINQHPNLYPGVTFAKNRYLYENLLYNLFNLIGAGTTFTKTDMRIPSMEVEQMIAEGHSLSVNPELCLSEKCINSCHNDCMFCMKCLSKDDIYEQIQAYREQMNLGDFKRIFPPEKAAEGEVEERLWMQVSMQSRMMSRWFKDMCNRNQKFC